MLHFMKSFYIITARGDVMTLQELLLQFKARTGLNNEAIANSLGLSKSTVSRWTNGDTKNLKKETVAKLSQLLGVDITSALAENSFIHKKPILGIVKAGYDLFAEENHEGYLVVNDEDDKLGDYFLRVTGDSMYLAKIHDQDLIYVKQCEGVPNGAIAVVMVGEEVTVKKVIIQENLFILEAANPQVENRYFTPEEVVDLPVRVLGRVIYSRSDSV